MCKKRNRKTKSIERKLTKYNMRLFYFETLVLELHCYCGDKIRKKYGLSSKHLFQRQEQHGGGKKLKNNDKRP